MDPVKTATGGLASPPKPKFLVLTAQEINDKADVAFARDVVKMSRVEFKVSPWPPAPGDIPLLEECRVLCDLENFDNMYDLTMQYLAGRDIEINMLDDTGEKRPLGAAHIIDKFTDLRVMKCVEDSPWLVNWLVEFMAGYLSKKFPLPLPAPAQKEAAKRKNKAGSVPKTL